MKDTFHLERAADFADCPHDYADTVGKDHGRIETRRCGTTGDPAYLAHVDPDREWCDLVILVWVECEHRCGDRVATDVRCFIPACLPRPVPCCRRYAGTRLLDRELHLPAAWMDDPARLQAVGLAPDTPFATKPQLSQRMLARVREAGLPVAWVTGDTVYGRATELRRGLEDAGQHHVLAVPHNESLRVGRDIWAPEAVHAVHADHEWYRLSAGAGSKGERGYDWQCRVLAEPEPADWGRYLLFRRSLADPDD